MVLRGVFQIGSRSQSTKAFLVVQGSANIISMMKPLGLVLLAIAVLPCVCANLDLSRVHFIDAAHLDNGMVNFFFRSNLPVNDTTFDYDSLV